MRTFTGALLLAGALAGCASAPSGGPRVVAEPAPERLKAMWEPLKSLAGEWVMTGKDGQKSVACVIDVSSGGTIVRERLFPGTENEMTNVYCMDGGDVLLTHYCHAGNQPRMKATSGEAGTYAFALDTVTLGSADEFYMGSMTLKILDADHIEEAWDGVQGDKRTSPMVVLKAERKK